MNPNKIKIQATFHHKFSDENAMFLFISENFEMARYRCNKNDFSYLEEAEKLIMNDQENIKSYLLAFHNDQTNNSIEFAKIIDFKLLDVENTKKLQFLNFQKAEYRGNLTYVIESEEHILINTHSFNTIVFYSQKKRDLRFLELPVNYKCLILSM